jgi:hypothetical protein
MTTPSQQPANYNMITQYGPWIVLAVVLTGAAQFDSTAQLAAAFAYLILVAAALWYGPVALTNINGLTKGVTSTATPSGSPIVNSFTGFVTGTKGSPIVNTSTGFTTGTN